MASPLSQYVEERIRRPAPADSYVVARSTPVVSFGDARIASVATLGLNPSQAEFLDGNGQLLEGSERRLATHASLETSDLARAPARVVMQVLDDCNSYFARKPYWLWFKKLAPTLKACGASYSAGSACHLDLVQWATKPTWGKLRPAALRERLIADDAKFLASQLQQENLRLLLVNGTGALRQLRGSMPNELELQKVETIDGFPCAPTTLFAGRIFGRVRVVAWTTNLQSSFGVTKGLRDEELPRRVALLA